MKRARGVVDCGLASRSLRSRPAEHFLAQALQAMDAMRRPAGPKAEFKELRGTAPLHAARRHHRLGSRRRCLMTSSFAKSNTLALPKEEGDAPVTEL
jgi:hypothetical protein